MGPLDVRLTLVTVWSPVSSLPCSSPRCPPTPVLSGSPEGGSAHGPREAAGAGAGAFLLTLYGDPKGRPSSI